jgi:hypothetical protein
VRIFLGWYQVALTSANSPIVNMLFAALAIYVGFTQTILVKYIMKTENDFRTSLDALTRAVTDLKTTTPVPAYDFTAAVDALDTLTAFVTTPASTGTGTATDGTTDTGVSTDPASATIAPASVHSV